MLDYEIDWQSMSITFSEKPPESIRSMLKYNRYRWNGGEWYPGHGASSEFIESALGKAIDKINGIRRPDGKCWNCENKNGFFRNHGAATPVLCDNCAGKK